MTTCTLLYTRPGLIKFVYPKLCVFVSGHPSEQIFAVKFQLEVSFPYLKTSHSNSSQAMCKVILIVTCYSITENVVVAMSCKFENTFVLILKVGMTLFPYATKKSSQVTLLREFSKNKKILCKMVKNKFTSACNDAASYNKSLVCL